MFDDFEFNPAPANYNLALKNKFAKYLDEELFLSDDKYGHLYPSFSNKIIKNVNFSLFKFVMIARAMPPANLEG